MKIRTRIVAALFTLAAICTLGSCSTPGGEGAEPVPKTGYAASDSSYTAEISDGVRTVTLDVTRERGVVTANVTAPDELSGTGFICDMTGVGIVTEGDTLTVSTEGSAGLRAIFDALSHDPTDEELIPGAAIRTECGGFECVLSLGADGYPLTLDVTRGTYKRCVRFSSWRHAGD